MEQPPSTPVIQKTPAPFGGRLPSRAVIIGAVVLVALAILILPPVQVPTRISWLGCTQVSSKSPDASGPDGLTVSLTDAGGALRLKMSRMAQGKLPGAALKAMPANATPLGPLYQLNQCGSGKTPVKLSVPTSADTASADMLDLMSWDGKSWQWVGSHADLTSGALVAQLDALPPNVIVMQTTPAAPVIGAQVAADAPLSDRAFLDVNEFDVTGLLISNDGGLQGNPAELPAPVDASHAMFALTRNWLPDAAANAGMVEDVLSNARLRVAHVKALTEAAAQAKYTGITVDYRGISADMRKAFAKFIAELAASLHKSQKQLAVVVPAPVQRGDEWDTAGYDWKAIGAAADVVQVDAPADPMAYGSSRRVEMMLRWATGEINRSKLQVAFPASSVKQTGNTFQLISYEDALMPFKAITMPASLDEVAPGAQVKLALGEAPGLEFDEALRMYRYDLAASDGTTSTVWINTGASLSPKLGLALRFGLRGVTVKGLLASNEPGVWTALGQYLAQAVTAVPAQLQVVWTVRGADGAQLPGGASPLTDTTFVLTAPADPGRFTVAAALPGATTRGEVALNVAQPTPTPTPAPTATPEPEATRVPGTTDKCPDAKFVADVTVPDNTQLDKGKEFTKTWKIQNSGECDWPDGTVAAFASGEKMGAQDTVKVGAVKSGESVEISVKMKAPDKDENLKATWRLIDDKGNLFGEYFTVVIVSGQPQAVAAAAVPAGEQPAASAASSAPPPVPAGTSGGFELGGQVNSFAFPDKMHYAGMNWVKHQVRWGPGDQPGPVAGVIADAHNKGFKVLLSVLGGAAEAKPSNFPSYAAFVGGLAALGPDAIEIWNEENIDREWQNGQVNPATYTELLKQSYVAIKNANRNVMVISGAPAPTGFFGGCSAAGCDDAPYIAGMAAAGAANYMDCAGIHYNEGIIGPNQTSGDPRTEHYTRYFWGMVNTYYNAFGRKLCFTEMGYLSPEGYGKLPGGFAWAQNTSAAQQAQWLAEAASLSASSGKVRLIIVFNVDFDYWGEDPQAGYAIIRRGGGCPACETLHGVLGTR